MGNRLSGSCMAMLGFAVSFLVVNLAASAAEQKLQVAAALPAFSSRPPVSDSPRLAGKRDAVEKGRQGDGETGAAASSGGWGQISGETVNVRSGPGIGSAIISTLHAGEFIQTKGVQGNWLKVEWPRNAPGWVLKDAVDLDSKNSLGEEARLGVVKFAKLKVFGQGNPNSTVIGELEKNDSVRIIGETGDWYKIQAPEAAVAFINAKYVVTSVLPAQPETPAQAQKPVVHTEPAKVQPAAPAAPAVAAVNAPKVERGSSEIELKAAIEKTRIELNKSAAEIAKLAGVRNPLADDHAAPAKLEPAAAPTLHGSDENADAVAAQKRREEQQLAEAETARLQVEARQKALDEQQQRAEALATLLQNEAQQKALAEERKIAEEHRAAVESQQKILAEQQQRAEALALRLQTEAQERALAEQKHYEDQRRAIATAARLKAEAEEKVLAEKRQQEAQSQELSQSAQQKARVPDVTDGALFASQPKPEPAPLQASNTGTQPVNSAGNKAPGSAGVPPAVVGKMPANPVMEDYSKPHPRFVVSKNAPSRPGELAEIVNLNAIEIAMLHEKEAAASVTDGTILPAPSGAAPPSVRLKAEYGSQVQCATSGGQLVSAEGLLERRSAAPMSGAKYALVQNGITLHFLTARSGSVDLESLVGRQVSITGSPLQAPSSGDSILEVGSATPKE